MAGPNGVALVGATRSLRVVYETITYAVETPDGETVSLAGYKRGPGCPISVEIEVEGAWAEWSEDQATDEDREALTTHRYMAKMMRAERMLRRNLLCAVIPGLSQEAADVLAGDAGPWEDILAELGWWSKSEQTTEGEATAGDQTTDSTSGAPASLDSASPTPDAIPS